MQARFFSPPPPPPAAAALGIVGDFTSHTSDYFDVIEGHARRMIAEGKAFMDNTPREAMQAERMALEESAHRNDSVEANAANFDRMLKGGEDGSPWCLRMKMDMKASGGGGRPAVCVGGRERGGACFEWS